MLTAGVIAGAKLAGVAASLITAWTAWRTMPESVIRRKMMQVFKDGGIVKTIKRGPKSKLKDFIIPPKIQRVGIYQDRVQIVFTLPQGVNPVDVHKHLWLFKQAFGEHLEMSEGVKTLVLNVYRQDMVAFDYDYEDISPKLNGLHVPIYVGRSRHGHEFYDMVEFPHLLIAGETGGGKSAAVRSILTTLIKTAGDRMKLYCADLKRSEFHLFRGVAEEVVNVTLNLHTMLLKIQKELVTRGKLLDKAELANILDLPEKQRPPFIVLAIDEVALLKKEKELMDIVEEISAIGRALGVFLILSMQRPDAQVLDGKLKNNLTVRMALRHQDEINSRITIGSGEAAEILNSQRGRMVFKLDGLKFVQGPYLELSKAKTLLAPYKRTIVTVPVLMLPDEQQEEPIWGELQ